MALLLYIITTACSYQIYSIGIDSKYFLSIDFLVSQLPGLNFHFHFHSFEDLLSVSPELIDVIISSSEDSIQASYLKSFSETFNIPQLILSSGIHKSPTFYSDYPSVCLSNTIVSLLKHFFLSRPSLLWSYSAENLEVVENIHLNSSFDFSHVSFLNHMTSHEISVTITKILKQKGIKNYFILPDDSFCGLISEGFQKSFLNVKGNFATFFTSCIYQTNIEGALFLTYDFFEDVKNEAEYRLLKIKKFLDVLENRDLSSEQLLKILEKVYDKQCRFSIVNIQDGIRKIIGKAINGEIYLNDSVKLFGNISDLGNYTKSQVIISANTGAFNPNGVEPAYANVGNQEGTYFAVEKINNDHSYFTNHQLILYDKIDCGVSVFDYNFSKNCFLKHRSEMGISYIPTFFPVTLPLLKQLYTLNISIPFIGGIGSSGLLSNKSEYPYFLRTVSPSSKFASAWANLIRLFGWNKIVAHYTNDSFGSTAYKILNSSQEEYGFQFVNDEKFRGVEYIYSYDSLKPYYGFMKNTLSIGCNIIFLMMGDPTPYFWLEGFYDLGVRRGDYTFIFFTITGLTNFDAANANLTKRKELMHGTFVIYNGAWVGEYGDRVKQEYLKTRKDAWGRSYFIDAVYTAAETADFLMNQGRPYEDRDVFMQAARNIRFLGTTGTISFDPDLNDRNMYYYNLFNFYEDESGKWKDDAVALISPLGTVYYTVLQDPVWVTGELPKSMKENYLNCPFRKDQIENSSSSINIKIAISVTMVFISTTLTIYALNRMRFKKIMMIQTKLYIEFEDYLIIGFIFVESIQMIAIGPSFTSFNRFLSNISEILSLNISKVTDFKDTTFWVIFFSILFLSYAWILLFIICYFRVFRIYPSLFRRLEDLKSYSIPIMSNYMFLPTIVSLISILMCDKAISDDYTDSYLNYDCNTYCWKSDHIIYVTLACFQIIIYIPIAILHRTLWQEENKAINIRTNSVYLILKNISIVVLVIVGRILKNNHEFIHGIVFLSISICLFILVIVIRTPFNYDRANLWCKVMLFCVVWNTSVCILGMFVVDEGYALVILQILGWIIIFTTGLCFQSRLPENLLISIKGRSIVDLFKFAFGIQPYHKSIYIVNEDEGADLFEEQSRFN